MLATSDRGQGIREWGFRRLEVWKRADELAYKVYVATKTFPKHEMFGLVSQMRRSYERLNYINKKQHDELVELRDETGRMLNGLIKTTGGQRYGTR